MNKPRNLHIHEPVHLHVCVCCAREGVACCFWPVSTDCNLPARAYGNRTQARSVSLVLCCRLSSPDVAARGWLLDGYPRSASQAEAIEKEGIRPDIFLLIDVSSAWLRASFIRVLRFPCCAGGGRGALNGVTPKGAKHCKYFPMGQQLQQHFMCPIDPEAAPGESPVYDQTM